MPPFGYPEFGEQLLGKAFYAPQRNILEALDNNGAYVAGVCANGAGKTKEIILTAILGHLTLHRGKVISTSGSFRQIKDQLTPALKAYETRFPAYRFLDNRIETPDPNCFWDGFSTNEAGKFEGHHGSEQHPLLIIVDEAKTVKDPIFQAIERCRPPRQWCRVLVVSSPGYAQGEFYRLVKVRPDALTAKPVKITAAECPHISPEEIAATRQKWGSDHPLVRSMLDAEFMEFVQGAIVQLQSLDDLLANPPVWVNEGGRKAFGDPAWSESAAGDESTLALRNGNRITLEACFRERGLHATAARYAREFVRLGLHAWEIEMDADGEGEHLIRLLHSMGWPIGRFHGGQKPRYNDNYQNLWAEVWCEGARQIIERRWILPEDPDLYGQMLNRKIVPNNKGLLAIESKLAMKDPNREGGPVQCSPDRADAVFGAMAPMPIIRPVQMGGVREQALPAKSAVWQDDDADQEPTLPGTHFG